MESGNNSGSLQSSSGGAPADEFDSQPFIFSSTNTNNSITNSNNLSFFDPLSNLLSPPTHPPTHPPAPPPAPVPAPRRSKKRTRASRRAPTTVLTTDTSNFRAMVQEFTGIPSPPFPSSSSTSSSAYPRSLFNPSPFLLKPYPQKFQPHPPPTNFMNYQLPSSSNSNLLNFQSLLHSQLTAPPKTTTSSADQYGLADHIGLPGVIGSGWGQEHAVNPTQLRQQGSSVNNMSSCKLNYSAPGSMPLAPEFGAEKGGEARGSEGMLESWICSSD